jgi:hypothetical protein
VKKTNERDPAVRPDEPTPKKFTHFSLRTNLIFACCILALAAALVVWRVLTAKDGRVATINFGYGITEEIPLAEDNDYYYDVGEYIVHIQVQDGKVAFVDSQCPDLVCEAFGWLEEEGDWACCMPAGAFLTVGADE